MKEQGRESPLFTIGSVVLLAAVLAAGLTYALLPSSARTAPATLLSNHPVRGASKPVSWGSLPALDREAVSDATAIRQGKSPVVQSDQQTAATGSKEIVATDSRGPYALSIQPYRSGAVVSIFDNPANALATSHANLITFAMDANGVAYPPVRSSTTLNRLHAGA